MSTFGDVKDDRNEGKTTGGPRCTKYLSHSNKMSSFRGSRFLHLDWEGSERRWRLDKGHSGERISLSLPLSLWHQLSVSGTAERWSSSLTQLPMLASWKKSTRGSIVSYDHEKRWINFSNWRFKVYTIWSNCYIIEIENTSSKRPRYTHPDYLLIIKVR